MENIEEGVKKQIESLKTQIDEIKNDFVGISGTVSKLDFHEIDIDILNSQLKLFSKLIFIVEEVGKSSATLFVNKNIYNDSTELTKYLHHSKLKMEIVKEAYINKDKNGFAKNLSNLVRSLDSAEYILSLFIGEVTSEITKVVFNKYIEKKSINAAQENMAKIMENLVVLKERIEKCENKLSLLMRKRPREFLEEEEVKVLDEMMRIHSENVQWVEPRFLEKELDMPISRINDILDDFLKYRILEEKLRGGMKVYKYKFGEKNDIYQN